jgi:O-succinylbenzoic acid--CoA ligase
MDSTQKIDWQSDQSLLFLNPRLSLQESTQLKSLFDKFNVFPGHIWLASSGSSQKSQDSVKLIALPKIAFLIAAQSVNTHLGLTSKDKWLQILPRFHVGGLSIEAREFVGGAQAIEAPESLRQKWSPHEFQKVCAEKEPTWLSLVPTQVFDLVEHQIKCPSSIRGVVVGGGALSEDLYLKAKQLGYPLLPSYGMTETCAQIATAKSGEEWLKTKSVPILDHVKVRTTEDQILEISSPSLLTGFAQIRNGKFIFEDPKHEMWYTTSDRVLIENNHLKFLGRLGEYVKILGEGVDLVRLREVLSKVSGTNSEKLFLTSKPDPRSGHQLFLYSELGESETKSLIEQFNAQVLPYERITNHKADHKLLRTALGKIKAEQD